ncbi:MAG: hypothetical protein JOZ57_10005 [Abitibacteriaceae bacterium]|nr:hypothetical protein [Abditibacteriaceae bacterium]
MIELSAFPSSIAAHIRQNLPGHQTMWWVRGLVLDIQQVERPTENPDKQNPGGRLRDLLLKVGDVDNPNDGYDVRIEGVYHQVEINDPVSLMGHEPITARRVSFPRLYINHSTGEFERAYPVATRLTYGAVPLVEHKYWLAAKTPANFAEKCKNLWILIAALAIPFFFIASFMGNPLYGGFIMILTVLLMTPLLIFSALAWAYIQWLTSQPRFSHEGKAPPPLWVHNIRQYVNFNRTDLTPLYEWLGDEIDTVVSKNPDPEKEFVPVARGIHTVGLLTASSPPVRSFEG